MVKYGNKYLTKLDFHTFEKDKSKAIVFDSIEKAKEHFKDWGWSNFRFVKFNAKERKPKEKNFVIQYISNYGKCFMRKHTRNSIYHTTCVDDIKQKFETKEKAQEFIDTILKGFSVRECEVIDIRQYN